jgi:hypothetical protein
MHDTRQRTSQDLQRELEALIEKSALMTADAARLMETATQLNRPATALKAELDRHAQPK